METVTLPASVGSMILHRESGLVAVAADDCCLRIIDMATMKIVREFRGHRSHITDMVRDAWIVLSILVKANVQLVLQPRRPPISFFLRRCHHPNLGSPDGIHGRLVPRQQRTKNRNLFTNRRFLGHRACGSYWDILMGESDAVYECSF